MNRLRLWLKTLALARVKSLRSERGAVAVIVAVSLVPLLGMAALAVEIGAWYQNQRLAQSAADAAALAAMVGLPNATTARTTATTYAHTNSGFHRDRDHALQD